MSNECTKCNLSPSQQRGPGKLHLKFPIPHVKSKAERVLSDANFGFDEKDELIAVEVEENGLLPLARTLDGSFSRVEANGIKAYFEANDRQATFADFFDIESLSTFVALVQAEWVTELIETKQFSTYFQPIVSCPKPSDILGFECLFRGHRGEDLIPPIDIFGTAKAAEIISFVDLVARKSAIECAVRAKIAGKLFINFAPTAIYDPDFCLASTIALLEQHGISSQRVCFEIVETEQIASASDLSSLCDYYRRGGFGIVLDDVGAGYSGLNLITELKPDYVKIDNHLIRGVQNDSYKASYTSALIAVAQKVGVKVVCEGVEDNGEYEWVRSQGADFVQGFLFGRPSASGG